VPTVLDHDVRAAGLAERTIGLARDRADSLVAVIGTGIAAVITSAGRHVSGARWLAGELGHMAVWPDGEECPCGQRGCPERYASAASIARRYAERGGERVRAALATRVIWRDVPPVELSTLGSRAVLLGAAILAWQAAGVTDFEGWTREAEQ
jgi:predicted NBD/HSP70 family sugar kinase